MVTSPNPDLLKETHKIYRGSDIYWNTPIVDDKLSYYEPYKLSLSDDDEYIELEMRHQYRPYVLSYDLYGTDTLHWIFAQFNPDLLFDPIRDMQAGLILRVPTKARVISKFPVNFG